MDDNEYLQSVLESQCFADDSEEMEALRRHRADVEELLLDKFAAAAPTIRYGGSKAKGTLIKEMYDLDIVFYVPKGENGAGDTLEEIYNNVKAALADEYWVEEKTSALRLKSKDPGTFGVDFHIDVVPGRYTDDNKSDCYLYQKSAEKGRLKTNLDVHIGHIKDSGVRDALRLLKLLRCRKGLRIKQFAYEILLIKLLKNKKSADLSTQLEHALTEIQDAEDAISIEDPANPSGNDLMPLLRDAWADLRSVARSTLDLVSSSGWEAVFGTVEISTKAKKIAALSAAATVVTSPTRPWSA